MRAFGYIRFVCRCCGERFWCRVSDQSSVPAICHECDLGATAQSGPDVSSRGDALDGASATSQVGAP